jgi:two-component system cell cycle response regulator DivK
MSASRPSSSPLSGKCVLLVDDDPRSTKLLSLLLAQEQCHVQPATDAASALRLVLAGLSTSLAVIDLHLPEMGGLDLVRALRAWAPTCRLPIVAMSASGPEYSEATALAAGCTAFIAKPIDPETFATTLAAHVGGRRP